MRKKQISVPAENIMRTMSENKLLMTISFPMMVSMLVQALYNIVDSIFVSQISENALTAVSLTFPVQTFIIAVSVGTAVGINALLSKSLGANDIKTANEVANTGVFLSIMGSLLFVFIGFCFSRIYFTAQVDIPEIIQAGQDYMFYNCVFSIGCFGQVVYSRLLQSTGKTFHSMNIQLVGALTNIVLDPILIFGWFGMPAMGVKGAAIATVIGQGVAALLGLYLNCRYNKEIKLSFRAMKPKADVVRSIYRVGLPAIIMQTTGAFMVFGFNRILLGFSATAVALFGIYFKIQSFFFMPLFGLSNGIVSIVAYNYGAEKPERIMKTAKLSMLYGFAMLMLGFLAFQLMPAALLSIFGASEELLGIGTIAFRIISLSFPLSAIVLVGLSLLQALGEGMFSMVVALIRQLVVLLPMAYLLSLTGNLHLVWLSFPIAESVAFICVACYLRKAYKGIIVPMREREQARLDNPEPRAYH